MISVSSSDNHSLKVRLKNYEAGRRVAQHSEDFSRLLGCFRGGAAIAACLPHIAKSSRGLQTGWQFVMLALVIG